MLGRGRTIECSVCGNKWFQTSERALTLTENFLMKVRGSFCFFSLLFFLFLRCLVLLVSCLFYCFAFVWGGAFRRGGRGVGWGGCAGEYRQGRVSGFITGLEVVDRRYCLRYEARFVRML